MSNDINIKHGESARKYVCANCGGQLDTQLIINVKGEPKSICKSSKCVKEKNGNFEKGVVVNVKKS